MLYAAAHGVLAAPSISHGPWLRGRPTCRRSPACRRSLAPPVPGRAASRWRRRSPGVPAGAARAAGSPAAPPGVGAAGPGRAAGASRAASPGRPAGARVPPVPRRAAGAGGPAGAGRRRRCWCLLSRWRRRCWCRRSRSCRPWLRLPYPQSAPPLPRRWSRRARRLQRFRRRFCCRRCLHSRRGRVHHRLRHHPSRRRRTPPSDGGCFPEPYCTQDRRGPTQAQRRQVQDRALPPPLELQCPRPEAHLCRAARRFGFAGEPEHGTSGQADGPDDERRRRDVARRDGLIPAIGAVCTVRAQLVGTDSASRCHASISSQRRSRSRFRSPRRRRRLRRARRCAARRGGTAVRRSLPRATR